MKYILLLVAIGFVLLTFIELSYKKDISVGAPLNKTLTKEEIDIQMETVRQMVDTYYLETGEYLQLTKEGALIKSELGTFNVNRLPAQITAINNYNGPNGKGFYVEWTEPTKTYMYGFGPDADAYTRVITNGTST